MGLIKLLCRGGEQSFLGKHGRFFLKKQILAAERFLDSAKNPMDAQRKYLMGLIERTRGTCFGREHSFDSVRSIDDFRRNVPIGDYESVRPFIERVISGETNALFSQAPLMFLRTSGTLDKPKYIPVTRQFLEENKESFGVWINHLISDHPNIPGGKTLIVSSPNTDGAIGKYKCASYSGWIRNNQPFLAKLFYAIPKESYELEDENLRYYAIIRTAIEQDISSINTANPSTILNLVRKADEKSHELIRDVYDGTLDSRGANLHDQRILKRMKFKPNPARARELEEILHETGKLYPKDYWENLVAICCWTGGSQSIFYSRFDEYFGNVPRRDLGFLASEGRVTIPVADGTSSGPLAVNYGFFEFIPEDEIDKKEHRILTLDKVEKGKNYFIALTNSSGLFRYSIGDRVQVTGHYENTPEICFLDKGKHCSSLTGEKITESHVVMAMRDSGYKLDNFMVSPADNQGIHYALAIEQRDAQNIDLRKMQQEFDKHLKRVNIEYDSKRQTRLGGIEVVVVPDGTFAGIKARKIMESGRSHDAQYKPRFLTPEINYHETLLGQINSGQGIPVQA